MESAAGMRCGRGGDVVGVSVVVWRYGEGDSVSKVESDKSA